LPAIAASNEASGSQTPHRNLSVATTDARSDRERSPASWGGLARDAALNEAVGPHPPHRGPRPLPRELALTTNGAGFGGSGLARDCSLKRSRRLANAASRPLGRSYKQRACRRTEPGCRRSERSSRFHPQTKPAAGMRRVATLGSLLVLSLPPEGHLGTSRWMPRRSLG